MSQPQQFLDIQITFAKKVTEILNISLNDALFSYTSLPIRFGIPFSELKTDNPIWQQFLQKINDNQNINQVAYNFYLEQEKNSETKQAQFGDRTTFGCFSYNLLNNEKGLLLHFSNSDDPEPGALSEIRMPNRIAELKEMFTDIKTRYPDFEFVASSSWLYNINAFNRLFPKEFIDSKQIKIDYRSMGMWGQFLDKYGNTKNDKCEQFLNNVSQSKTQSDLENSFPLKDLKVATDLVHFYKMYQVD